MTMQYLGQYPKLYQGSVKDLLGPVQIRGEEAVIFQYSDAYSVFDWGRMPDLLPGKGQALAILAAYIFEKMEEPATWQEFSKTPVALDLRKGVAQLSSETALNKSGGAAADSLSANFNELGEVLQKEGLRTHYLGLLPEGNKTLETVSLRDLKLPIGQLVARKVSVVRPIERLVMGRSILDYHPTRSAPAPRLVPLEVVFRYSCPPGSSLLERAARDPAYFASLPMPRSQTMTKLQPCMHWDFPVLELFTKLESSDRSVSLIEALAISGISSMQLQEILLKTIWISGYLKVLASGCGLDLADGKIEWALLPSGDCMLVDAVGPDELRLLSGPLGSRVQLSKEFLRTYYRKISWYESLVLAKRKAKTVGVSNWKGYVKEDPPVLPQKQRELAIQMYLSLTNAMTGKTWFPYAWPLEHVMYELQREEAEQKASGTAEALQFQFEQSSKGEGPHE